MKRRRRNGLAREKAARRRLRARLLDRERALLETFNGPHGWLNWQAQRLGAPERTGSTGVVVRPIWEELGLYSDAWFTGELTLGPAQIELSFASAHQAIGRSKMQLVLRVADHLADPPPGQMDDWRTEDTSRYFGGGIGDEYAALLALALARRIRNGGPIRWRTERDPEAGRPFYAWHRPQQLEEPIHRPLLPAIADTASLPDAGPLLQRYSALNRHDATAVVRAARQYADALWWADADPRIAWIKLVGALETASNSWDQSQPGDDVDRLKRLRGRFYGELKRFGPDVVETVASNLSKTLAAEAKFIRFTTHFASDPPEHRPSIAQLDWATLADALRIIYEWRSLDLHAGVPFPEPLCETPHIHDGHPVEVFPALAASASGGRWPAARLPMYLHTFTFIAGQALRRWWLALPDGAPHRFPRLDEADLGTSDHQQSHRRPDGRVTRRQRLRGR